MKTRILIISLSGFIAVTLGALGAHAFKELLSPEQLKSFETAVRYQLIHTMVLFVLIALPQKFSIKTPFILFICGIVLFSGSIYLLVFDEFLNLSLSFLGPITPLGGLLLISAWLSFGFINYRKFK